MNRKTLDVLDFQQIQRILVRETLTPMGQDIVMCSFPCSLAEARVRQSMVREVQRASAKVPVPSLRTDGDPRAVVTKIDAGAVLSPHDLALMLQTLSVMDSVRSWTCGFEGPQFSQICSLGRKIPPVRTVIDLLEKTVTPEGEIKDSASELLRKIRREIRRRLDDMRHRLESLCRSSEIAPYLQEPVVGLRSGTYVLPVKQEYASRVSGVIHDQSGSGQTVFIEPLVIVEMRNELRKLELAERDEVERILEEITSVIRGISGLKDAVAAIGELDFAVARMSLMEKWHGVMPELSDGHEIILRKAWHPLLRGRPVPLDLSLGGPDQSTRTLVITGPNMGGKTVALKTVGLLAALALSGLPVPAGEGTVVGDLSDILVDIGDEQSIQEDLSTFSAHIKNIMVILDQAGPGKLVLIDELGAGTDPGEGAALGLAVLRRLHSSGALVVVSTHYSEMKTLAHETPGMENASMEWDPVNMVPTYKLVVGRPGRSNGLDVALKIGLPPEIVREARDLMPRDVVRLEDMIREMERKSRELDERLHKLREDSVLYQKLREEVEAMLGKTETERREILSAARQEAREIVRRVRVETEKLVKDLRKASRGEDRERVMAAVRDRLGALEKAVEEEIPLPTDEEGPAPVSLRDIGPGVQVRVRGFREPGRIVEPPDEAGTFLVQVGPIVMRVGLTDIVAVSNAEKDLSSVAETPHPRPGVIPPDVAKRKAAAVKSEIDLRGTRASEALDRLDKYLDDAYLAGLRTARIIHGKGTGALRKAVADFLEGHPHVKEFHPAEIAEGGYGVTVVVLKG